MQTYSFTIDSSADIFEVVNVADYTTAMIKLSGIWNGPIEFYGDNTPGPMVLLAVQDISGTNWTTAAVSEAGSSPSEETKMFRAPVAGLTRLGIYGDFQASPAFTGSVSVVITLVSDTNAR